MANEKLLALLSSEIKRNDVAVLSITCQAHLKESKLYWLKFHKTHENLFSLFFIKALPFLPYIGVILRLNIILFPDAGKKQYSRYSTG